MRRLFETSPCMRAVFEHELRNACVFGQAESAMDQMDWIEKITGVIASLLSSHSPEQVSEEHLYPIMSVKSMEQLIFS